MGGCIVQVWYEVDREFHDRPPFFAIIETEFEDFATFCEAVDADQLIGGAILWTTREKDNSRLINTRQPCAFRGSAVMRCQLPTWRFVENEARTLEVGNAP